MIVPLLAFQAAVLLLCGAPLTTYASKISPNTSFATLPVAYFGGVTVPRPPENIEMLAKMRVVTIEKWEGGCFDSCGVNQSHGLPCTSACHGESYMLNTLSAVKKLNPSVSVGYYQNSLYDWTFQDLDAEFGAANENMRALNGSVIAMVQDNGLTGQHVFDLSQQAAVDRWMDWQKKLFSMDIDGVFIDKPTVVPFFNSSSKQWDICESGEQGMLEVGIHPWEQRCAPIDADKAQAYIKNKPAMLKAAEQLWYPAGGYIFGYGSPNGKAESNMIWYNSWRKGSVQAVLNDLEGYIGAKVVKYVSFSKADVHTSSTSTASLCDDNDIALFLIVAREGCFLQCDGWDDHFALPLGLPADPAHKQGDVYSRVYPSGTSVSFNDKTKKGTVKWTQLPPVM